MLDSEQGFWALVWLALFFGAAHALTPGHGKAVVAAYLVGEQGTIGHALLLGIVVTLTHTGGVIALAVLLRLFFRDARPTDVQFVLGTVGGLLIAGLGLWLLLRRLAGQADHVHLGGHGHHHHHDGPHHHHHHHAPAAGQDLGWGRLIVLGISGGIVPCWDAIIMLLWAVATQRLALALPLLLAFSAGLAAVLVIIGILVVSAKDWMAHWDSGGRLSRVFRVLPILSAALVLGLGLWLCYDQFHANDPTAPTAAARP